MGRKMEYEEIWLLGQRISRGHGFWSSLNLLKNKDPKEIVRAWVDTLRELNYPERDIILYGDWKDGRHIGDEITYDMEYMEFTEIMKKYARKIEEVHLENTREYEEEIRIHGHWWE